MATLDDSPSLFSGQQWTDWANLILPDLESETVETNDAEDNTVEDSMKLRKEDMPLFGFCPSRDEFYLVVCEKCNQVLKPQAFQAHLDIRHGGKGGFTTVNPNSTKIHQSSSANRHSVSSKSHSKSHNSPSKSHSKSSKSHSSPRKSAHIAHTPSPALPVKPSAAAVHSSGVDIHRNQIEDNDDKHSLPTKASVKEPPHSFDTATKVGAQFDTLRVKDSKLKKNHTMPVVKVERMPETLAMKKQRESTGSARTSLTNGAIRTSKSPPLSIPIVSESEIVDIKPCMSPLPVLSAPHTPLAVISEPEPTLPSVPASEINSAVNAILEAVSPVSEPETSGFVALATSSSTLTTNTVTMATMTMSSTTVTSVTNTTSSFTFSNMGRPHFPSGSIRVNFSSTGVLSALTGGISSSSGNLNNNNVTKTSINDMKPSLCSSNGSIESTINDIVKSTINVSNNGGFKSLSPLLTSPVKSASSSPSSSFSNSLKSPTGLGNTIKSFSATNSSKAGSKLAMGCSNVFKSLSTGSVPNSSNTSPSSTVNTSALNTEALKKFQLINKPDKIIPLKDREYDANKHCGVIVSETGKACTRSLTCKSHALSLRRAVPGRRLPFDDLLQEHRDAKEAYLKAKMESKEAAAALKASTTGSKVSPLHKSHSVTSMSATSLKPNAHLNQGLTKENKSLSVPMFSPNKSPQKIVTPAGNSRTSFSSLQLSSSSLRDEALSPPGKPSDRLLSDDSEEMMTKDDSYTTYHPRPIAACSFGARYHTNYGSGFGCHTFGRKTDHLRAAFLDLLERHLHPPPPKKLCVESNLPKENESLQSSTDPYEFGSLDSKNFLGHPQHQQLQQQQQQLQQQQQQQQHIIQPPSSIVATSIPNKIVSKSKSKQTSAAGNSSSNKTKIKDTLVGSKSPGGLTSSFPSGLLTSNSSAKKRRTSGCTINVTQGAINQSSLGATTIVSAPNIINSVGAISNSSGAAPQFAIAIPNVNISGATLSQINASLMASGNFKQGKNNVIKDMGFVVTGIPQEAILNGQYVNITGAQLTGGDVASNQVHQVTLDNSSKTLQQQSQVLANVNNKSTSQPKFINSINNIDAIRALQVCKNNLITSLPPNTLLLDSGTVLQPVSLSTATANPVMSVVNTAVSQHHQVSPATTTPSPHVNRSGSASPQVSTSPMPNGVVVSTQAEKELVLSHRQTVFQPKGLSQAHVQQQQQQQQQQRGHIQQTSHILTGPQLHSQNFTFQSPTPTTSVTNQISASQVLNTQLSQIQVKNSNIHHHHHKTGSVNKLTMQPMSLTIPFVTQNNVGGVGMGVRGQQTTHALFITSEDAQKQGIHLHQAEQPAQHSPSNTILS